MLFVDKVKADLAKIKEILKSGWDAYAYLSFLPVGSVDYRKNLVDILEQALYEAPVYGDDKLYELYVQAVNELQLGEIRSILQMTIQEIKAGVIQRFTGRMLIDKMKEKLNEFEQNNLGLQKINKKLLLENAKTQALLSAEQDAEISTIKSVDAVFTPSVIFKLEESIPSLVMGFHYEEAALAMSELMQRCFKSIKASQFIEMETFAISNEKINQILAQQIINQLKVMSSPVRLLSVFFSDPIDELFKALFNFMCQSNIYQLILDGYFSNKDDLILFVSQVKKQMDLYRDTGNLGRATDDYAKLIFNNSYQQFISQYQEQLDLDAKKQQLLLMQECRDILKSQMADIEAILQNLNQDKWSEVKNIFSYKGKEVVKGLLQAPLDYLLKTVELLISPATAIAKEFGQVIADVKHIKSQHPNHDHAEKQKQTLNDLLSKLRKVTALVEKTIVTLEIELDNCTQQKQLAIDFVKPVEKNLLQCR